MSLSRPLSKLFVLAAIVGCSAACNSKKNNKSEPTITLDNIVYKIQSSGVAYDVKDNQVDYNKGNHFVIGVEISNNLSKPVSFDRTDLVIVDGAGQVVLPAGKNDELMGPANELLFADSLEPNSTKEFLVYYLIPAPADYKLQITSPVTRNKRIISLNN
jgi:hypothetical protein